jgi:hypothetical protein
MRLRSYPQAVDASGSTDVVTERHGRSVVGHLTVTVAFMEEWIAQ